MGTSEVSIESMSEELPFQLTTINPIGTYRVTIRREKFRGRECWVARDKDGDWRAYGDYGPAPGDGCGIAEYLFHADEIKSVETELVNGAWVLFVELWDFSVRKD